MWQGPDTEAVLEDPSSAGAGEPARTVAAVARRLGVAPATLRTWDRRYGLGPSEHTPGTHRRYTPADVARLAEMRRLTLEGVAPSEAARHALSHPDHMPAASAQSTASSAGGGRVLALPGASSDSRGLARAAMALDDRGCTSLVRSRLATRGVVGTWQEIVAPVLVAVGARWEATGLGVDVEHLLSEAILVALRGTPPPAEPRNASPVLLACAEEDQHALALHVLRAALSERLVSARVLGGRVPRAALAAAVRRSGPPAVFLWSQMHDTANPEQLQSLPRLRPAPAVVVGGPGWELPRLPTSVHVVDSLSSAVERLIQLSCP